MRFLAVPVDQAEGAVLGHNVADAEGRRRLRKGRPLSTKDVELLRSLGRTTVWVARLDGDDVSENEAARRIADGVSGEHVERSGAGTGRVNLEATTLGLVRIDVERLLEVNELDGVTLATLPNHAPVPAGKMVATIKILPYGLSSGVVRRAEAVGRVLSLTPLPRRRCGLILCGSTGTEVRLTRGFRSALGRRLESLGSVLADDDIRFVPLNGTEPGEEIELSLAGAVRERLDDGVDLLLLAGETAIQDRHDLAPTAVERAGCVVEHFGAPVDPGNLLLLAYRDGVPIVGAPGCARSPKTNIVDLVLPRLLAGDRLGRRDVLMLGHGGLLDDVPERPLPRSRIGQDT